MKDLVNKIILIEVAPSAQLFEVVFVKVQLNHWIKPTFCLKSISVCGNNGYDFEKTLQI